MTIIGSDLEVFEVCKISFIVFYGIGVELNFCICACIYTIL